MDSIEKSYYTIGEVSRMLGEAPSLIRFWEKEFPQLKPSKSEKGTRKFNKKDIELLRLIHYLSREKGYTLDGVKDAIKNQHKTADKAEIISKLNEVKSFLSQLKELI